MQRALSTLDFKLFELNLESFRALSSLGYSSLAKCRSLFGLSRDCLTSKPHLKCYKLFKTQSLAMFGWREHINTHSAELFGERTASSSVHLLTRWGSPLGNHRNTLVNKPLPHGDRVMLSPYLANIDFFFSLLVSCLARKLTSLLAPVQDFSILPPLDPAVVPHGHQQGAENAFCNLKGHGTAPLGLA